MEMKKFHFNFLAALRVFCDTYAYHVVLSWEMYSRFSYNYLTRHPRSVLSQTLKKNHQVEMNVVCINIKQQQKNELRLSSYHEPLRANFCKYRESGDSFNIFNFLIFCPNKAFSELFSKIQLKDPKALDFFQNRGKFENRHFGLPPPLKIDKNDAFSFRSCW